ncbi:MAG: lamin tail domain-containing protein [Pseudomonadota bacterium]|nr:lamin tail domain-containing protein [Pseudomonadota bacterium]
MIALLLLACSMAGKWGEDTAVPGTEPDVDGDTDTEGAVVGVVISELMTNPDAVEDDLGEWFEVTNTGGTSVTLDGLEVRDDDDDGFTVSTLTLAPGAFAVFGASADTAVNGGAAVDHAYDVGIFKLGNDGGRVALLLAGAELDAVLYDATFPGEKGQSLTLSAAALDPASNDDAGAWCAGTTAYGAGDRGTPGATNDACEGGDTDTDTDIDGDGDGDGFGDDDCDPEDPDAYPGAPEVENGTDDDCDGHVDERAPNEGDLVLTEIMKDPDPTPDETGEWFELTNVADVAIELDGLTVTDEGGTGFVLATNDVLDPGAVYVLAVSADTALNDGVTPDYVYSVADLRLGNGDEQLVLSFAGETIDQVAYDEDFPDEAGKSLSLDPSAFTAADNDDAEEWCEGDGDYGTEGNQGTPGEWNDEC